MEENRKKLEAALLKRALGYSSSEETEEYSLVDGDMKLVKRKVSVKDIPPELSAIKLLLDESGDDYSNYTEEELEKEKARLIALLAASKK